MKRISTLLFLIATRVLFAQTIPSTKQIPDSTYIHNQWMIDNYSWIEDVENQDVQNLIKEESAFFDSKIKEFKKETKKATKSIFKFLPNETESAETYENSYWYRDIYPKNSDFPIFQRKKENADDEWELIFDEKDFINEFGMYAVWSYEISPDNKIAAIYVDWTGNFQTDVWFLDLSKTDEKAKDFEEKYHLLSLQIDRVSQLKWAKDSQHFFYLPSDTITNKTSHVYRSNLNDFQPELIYQEMDSTYDVYLEMSKSREYVFISSQNLNYDSEYWIVDRTDIEKMPTLFHKREAGHEYYLSHFNNQFYLLTDKNAPNFRICTVDKNNFESLGWKTIIEESSSKSLYDFEPFEDYIAYTQLENGANSLRIFNKKTQQDIEVKVNCDIASIYLDHSSDPTGKKMMYSYESYTFPYTTLSYDFDQNKSKILMQDVVENNFDPNAYTTETKLVKARDGEEIPLTLIYKNNVDLYGKNPVLQYGYGAYGVAETPYFDFSMFPLLEAGFVYAVSHVRGGGDKGNQWYEDGKMLNKKNSFNDFIDCTEYLIDQKIADEDKIVAHGRSAGGLLMGAVCNQRPDLYKAVMLGVPFVDIMNTMLNENLPLTVGEYNEWGNPNKKTYFDYMLSYSPYDNVEKKEYPHLFFYTGLHDEQVKYWEPLKMISKLRNLNPDQNDKFMIYIGEAGHGGSNSVSGMWQESAIQVSYILDVVNRE